MVTGDGRARRAGARRRGRGRGRGDRGDRRLGRADRARRAGGRARSRWRSPGGRGRAGWSAGFLYMALAMGALHRAARHASRRGCWLILWLVLVVVAADVGAYFVGRSVGGAKLWPRVSPGKTWSGAIGGLAFAGLDRRCRSGWRSGWSPVRIGAAQPRDRGLLAARRPARVGGQAAVRGQGREPADPRPRRGDGPARRGDGRRLVLRRLRRARPRRARALSHAAAGQHLRRDRLGRAATPSRCSRRRAAPRPTRWWR